MGAVAEPQRTCVGCRTRAAKRDLLRVARGPTGGIMVDTTGTAPGRGAYLHPMWDCAAAAFRHGAFTRGLRTVVSAEEAARLEAEIKSTVGAR